MRIIRYNESNDLDIEKYLTECFIEFIDENEATVYRDQSVYGVDIMVPNCWFYSGKNIDEDVDNTNTLLNFYENIKVCIQKVFIKYPNIMMNYEPIQDGVNKEVRIIFFEKKVR